MHPARRKPQPSVATHLPASRPVQRIKRLSYVLDSSIPVPGTSFRIGLDPLLGLLPIVGDALGTILSAYVVLLAMEAGASPWTLTRMVGNIAIESVLGSLPLVGDLFDAMWKANERNHRLLVANLNRPTTAKADRRLVILAILVLSACVAAAGWLALFSIKWLVGLWSQSR